MNSPLLDNSSASHDCCHLCGDLNLEIIDCYETFCRVTSDCMPLSPGGRLGACRSCGCIQKPADAAWRSEVESIYKAYAIYHQSNGFEQSVFDLKSGQFWSRSVRLLEELCREVNLPTKGRLLDIGCGNGALLRAFARMAPEWSLVGTELNDKYRTIVESIEGVEALYTCEPKRVPSHFDLITMVHVLEHIPGPVEFICSLAEKLASGGLLVIETPNYLQNAFDLLISDHCTHFTPRTLTQLLERAGFKVVAAVNNWVPKEISVIARRSDDSLQNHIPAGSRRSVETAVLCLQWLSAVVTAAKAISRMGHFGILGTSIAATWLFTELEGSVNFFVDEDPNRFDKAYLGRPVYHPSQIPRSSHVFIALPTALAQAVRRRLASPGVIYHMPPINTW